MPDEPQPPPAWLPVEHDPRAPRVDFGPSSYRELYAAAALRGELGHPELVPGAHSPTDAELRRYVREVLAERGTAARVGSEHLVAVYLRGLLVPIDRWWRVWQRAMVEAVRREQVADELAREAERRWPADDFDPEPLAEVPKMTPEGYGSGPDEADEPDTMAFGLLVDERPLRPSRELTSRLRTFGETYQSSHPAPTESLRTWP